MFTQKLIIKEFAQFKDITIDVDDVLLLIGEQATGKSTLLKWVYFFKAVRFSIMINIFNKTNSKDYQVTIIEFITTSIYFLFDDYAIPYSLKYQYSEHLFLEIHYLGNSKYNLLFNNLIEFEQVPTTNFSNNALTEIITDVGFIFEKFATDYHLEEKDYALLTPQEKNEFEKLQAIKKEEIITKMNLIFSNDNNMIRFVPAHRAVSEFFTSEMKLPTTEIRLANDFADYLQKLYPVFDEGFSGVIEKKKRQVAHKKENYNKNFEYAEEARKLIENGILKGNYSHSNGAGKLTTANNTTVSIFNASSGQQETLGMMIVIFLAILNGEATTLFIEEPEVHLYPTAQKTLVDLFCLFLNAHEGNKLYLSTHSPYILTSFNNLLYAHQLREKLQKLPPEKQIIKPYYWLDFQRLRAYQLQNGEVLDIRDLELGLIQAENIDKAASQQINGIFDQLFNLENE
jgi:hypothetical protein